MSGLPAARIGDGIICGIPQTTPAALPHAPPPTGLPITMVGALNVLIGGSPAARVGDMSICVGPAPLPNPIMRGAFPVLVMNMPAARMTDQGTHPGSMIAPPCCPTVLIGLAGTTGNAVAALAQCLNMAAGRAPAAGSTSANGTPIAGGTAGQSYNNCGVESSRQIIGQSTGAPPTQEGLLGQAIGSGLASQPALGSTAGNPPVTVTPQNQMFFSGGTSTPTIATLLTNNGVPASTIPPAATGPALSDIETAVAQGRGVVAPLNVSGLPGWGAQTGGHAVVVTGVQYDDAGNVTNVIYNDTGIGVCQQTAPAATFQNSLNVLSAQQIANGQTPMGFAVTNNRVW